MNTTRLMLDRAPLLLTALVLLMGLGGCSNALAPSFEAVGVREVERDADRSVLEFSVRATNPNPDPIPLRSVSYSVSIGDSIVFEGVRSPETTLHTFSSHEFVLPAVVPSALLEGSFDYALQGSVQYIPPGRLSEVLFDAEVRVPVAPIEIIGTINTGSNTGS
ncbi:MAG: LEA type 2 family protein [Phycisphaerales bacterium JB052]